jgi:hypothetical protein
MISTLQASSINTTTALGFGNYNAAFATLKVSDWHDINAISNFTWGRALGTAALAQYNSSNTALDPWNLRANYGPQNFDYQFIFNAGVTYQPNSFFGLYDVRNKHGILGQLLKGWSVSPFSRCSPKPRPGSRWYACWMTLSGWIEPRLRSSASSHAGSQASPSC